MQRHPHFEEIADQLIDSVHDGRTSKISRPLLAEVLSRVAVKTPPVTSRAEIAQGDMLRVALPLSEGSVSKAVAALLRCELLEELAPDRQRPGRPVTRVRLGHERWFSVGVHVHLTQGIPTAVLAVAASIDDNELASRRRPVTVENDSGGWPMDALVDAIVGVVEDVVDDPRVAARAVGGWLPLLGVGVELGRHVHMGEVVVTEAGEPVIYDLRQALTTALGLPVVVENDANALAVRETYGQNVRPDFALVLVTDEGIGAAIAADGRVYRGSRGMAGEIGHIEVFPPEVPSEATSRPGFADPCWCGRPSHIDAFATPARVRAEIGGDAADRLDLTALPADRVERAAAVLTAAGRCLGHALVAFVNIVNPGQLLLVLPPAFGQSGGQQYLDEIRSALDTAFSTGGTDAHLDLRFLTADQLAATGARAVAVRVIIEFIDHLSGIDGCLPSEPSFPIWLARGGAAIVGGALGKTIGPIGAAIALSAISRYASSRPRSRAQLSRRARTSRAPWHERVTG